MEFYTHSPKETEAVGARLGSALSPGSVVAYFGGLGMGKTAFTRGACRRAWLSGAGHKSHIYHCK